MNKAHIVIHTHESSPGWLLKLTQANHLQPWRVCTVAVYLESALGLYSFFYRCILYTRYGHTVVQCILTLYLPFDLFLSPFLSSV